MRVKCPFCGSEYETAPENTGKKILCTSCRNEFEVVNPNLTPCPDCFCLISKRAAVCPRCGAPLHADASGNSMSAKGQPSTAAEEEIMLCYPAAMNYLGMIIVGVLTSVLLVGLFILLEVWISIHFTSYRITNLRIIVSRGWISKTQTEIWIKDMRGANLQQGIWQRIIGVGNIAIGTAATAGAEICMIGISDPQKVVDTINSLR